MYQDVGRKVFYENGIGNGRIPMTGWVFNADRQTLNRFALLAPFDRISPLLNDSFFPLPSKIWIDREDSKHSSLQDTDRDPATEWVSECVCWIECNAPCEGSPFKEERTWTIKNPKWFTSIIMLWKWELKLNPFIRLQRRKINILRGENIQTSTV